MTTFEVRKVTFELENVTMDLEMVSMTKKKLFYLNKFQLFSHENQIQISNRQIIYTQDNGC